MFTKGYLLASALATLVGAISAIPVAANALVNGGFELSNSNFITPTGWTQIGHMEGVLQYAQFPQLQVLEGSDFYDIGGMGQAIPNIGDGITQTVNTLANTQYSLGFLAKRRKF